MQNNCEITRIVLVRESHGSDTVLLYTRLPNGIWPFDGEQYFRTEIARGKAEEWVEQNFPFVPFEKVVV